MNEKKERTVEDCEKIIAKLREENHNLRNQKPLVIQKKVTVPPADYETIKRDLRKAQEQLTNLQMIVEKGNMGILDTYIDQYMAMSRTMLRKITQQVNISSFATSTAKSVKELLAYLLYVHDELYGLISIFEEGRHLDDLRYVNLKKELIKIKAILDQKDLVSRVREENIDLLYDACKCFREKLEEALEEGYD